MAKKRSYRRAAKRVPMAATVGTAVSAFDLLMNAPAGYANAFVPSLMEGKYSQAAFVIQKKLVQFDTYKPMLFGAAASYGASKLKINRYLPFRL